MSYVILIGRVWEIPIIPVSCHLQQWTISGWCRFGLPLGICLQRPQLLCQCHQPPMIRRTIPAATRQGATGHSDNCHCNFDPHSRCDAVFLSLPQGAASPSRQSNRGRGGCLASGRSYRRSGFGWSITCWRPHNDPEEKAMFGWFKYSQETSAKIWLATVAVLVGLGWMTGFRSAIRKRPPPPSRR